MKSCSRCGRCCIFVHAIGEEPKRCQYLSGVVGTYTYCRIYEERFLRELAPNCYCYPREIQEKITPMKIKECTLL